MSNMEVSTEIKHSSAHTDEKDNHRSNLSKRLFPTGFKGEFKAIVNLAWPLFFTELFQFLFSPVSLAFCGRLGKIEMDGVAIAVSLINVTGLSVMVGLSSACDTMFSQIFGSNEKHRLGIALQRSLLIMGLCTLPCVALYLNAESILLLFGQDPEVARLAGRYLLIFIPGLLCNCVFIAMSKYLQNQNIVIPTLIIGGIANLVNALAHYVFVFVLEMRTDGSAVSQVLGHFSMLSLIILYILYSKVYVGTWTGWSAESLDDWGTFANLAIFGLFMTCIEWWSFEIGIFLAGVLGTTELGAQSIVFQINSLCYMVPLGIGIATSIRVGQFLGGKQPKQAQTATRVAFVTLWCIAGVMSILVGSLRFYLPLIFTNVPEVVALAAAILPANATYLIFDCTNGVGCGILRGMGRQKLGTCIMAVTYVLALGAGIPTLLLTDLGVIGFWWCLAGAVFIESCTLLTFIRRADWESEVQKAQIRIRAADSISLAGDAPTVETPTEKTSLLADKQTTTTSKRTQPRFILKRLGMVFLCFSMFLVGLLVRLLLPSQQPTVPDCILTNSTISINGTQVIC